MASSNQTPDVLFSPIAANADTSDINTIPQTYDPANYGYAAQNVGFPTECRLPVLNPDGTLGQGRAPRMQDWNGIMKLVSSHNFFLQNGGSYTFNPTVSSNIGGYPKNAILWYFPENEAPCIVYSLINDNTNNFVDNPTLIDGVNWSPLLVNVDLSNLSSIGEAHFANPDLSNLSATGEAKLVAVPVGSIIPYGGSTAPAGWLLCNGGAISRTTYADLFAVIGTAYGAGDGSTTFNLPNLSTLYLLNGLYVNTPAQYCRGTGLTMGFMTGNPTYPVIGMRAGDGGVSGAMVGSTGIYGTAIGTAPSGTGLAAGRSVGLTTDVNYSGVMRDAVTSTISNYISARAIIKY